MSAAKSSTTTRRPWYQPHVSTCVVTSLVALFFCIWNIAGYYRERGESIHYRLDSVWVYGWPATYLERSVEFPDSRKKVDNSFAWRPWERATGFFPAAFSLDLAVGGAASLLLGVAFEVWRRRRAHLLQIYLSELGVLTAVVCGFLGAGRYLILSATSEAKVLKSLEQHSLGLREFEFESGTPEFLRQWLPGTDYKAVDTVTVVRIHHPLSEVEMEVICHLRDLRALSLESPFPSSIWKMVAESRQLEEIWIDHESLGDDDLEVLTKLPRLRKLVVRMGTLSGASILQVGEVKSLEDLFVSEGGESFRFLKTEDLQPLTKLPLRKLGVDFHKSRCSECELSAVGQMKHLRELGIHNKQFTNQDVTALGQLSDLEDLSLSDCEFESADGARLFRSLTKLRVLTIRSGSISTSTGQAISEITGLESLRMYDAKSLDEDASWISRITSLRRLDYHGDQVSSSAIVKLAALTHLESLDLYGLGVDDAAIDAFIQMKALKTLKLTCDKKISPAGEKRLAKERPDLKVTIDFIYL